MVSSTPRLVLDAETYSTVDLAKSGAHAYAAHPDTGVHCVAWRIKGGAAPGRGLWLPGMRLHPAVIRHVEGRLGPVVAHNYLFELNIWKQILKPRYGWPLPSLEQWSCTMARALYHGLPAGLELLGQALELSHLKDGAGRSNMLRMARPRAVTADGPVWWADDPEEGPRRLDQLYAYCVQDTDAESEADDVLPELPAGELAVFRLDHDINQRGVGIDQTLIYHMRRIIAAEGARLNDEIEAATAGAVATTSQVARIIKWVREQGTIVESLDKAGVLAALGDPTCNHVTRPVLLLRQEAARASTAKLAAMHHARSPDGRARGMFQYYGAGRTGRWAGRRAQFQNYPRPSMKQDLVDLAIAWVLKGLGVEALTAMFPGSPLGVVSSCLRGCLIPSPGNVLYSVDLAQIEARVLAWLAGQADTLLVFASGHDVYTYTAAKLGSDDRNFGKVLVLACGFGMGPPRFQETALQYRLVLTIEQAFDAVHGWRDANKEIVSFWYRLGDAFKDVALAPSGTMFRLGFLVLRKQGRAVRVVLPSQRELVYQHVEIERDAIGRDVITYMGVHQYTRAWTRLRTYGGKLAENVTQAVARDVMSSAMLALAGRGALLVASIHDEALGEAPAAQVDAAYRAALAIFSRTPAWAPGLPVAAAGWVGPRYRKG